MTKTTKIVLVIALIILIPVVIYFVGLSNAKKDVSKIITIGATLPLTGATATYGIHNQKGIELALEKINQQGSINEQNLKIIYEDTESQQTLAVNNLQKLINVDNVPLILTGASSPETLAQAPVAEANKTVLIANGSASPKVRKAGDYIFRIKVSLDKKIEELIKFAYQDLNARKIYILYVQNDYGEGTRQLAGKLFNEMGGKTVGIEGFSLAETDFRTHLLKIKSTQPDVILLTGWASNVGQILKRAKELNINKPFIAPSGSIGPEVITIAESGANGLIYITEFVLNSERQAVKDFYQSYKEKYNEEPDLFSAMGYDSTIIVAKMLKICGPDATCIKNNLYQVQNHEGASGVISFDDHGDVIKPMIFMTIKDGKYVKYE